MLLCYFFLYVIIPCCYFVSISYTLLYISSFFSVLHVHVLQCIDFNWKKCFYKINGMLYMSEVFFCMSSYATAGDHFTVSPQCIPMGTFKLDLTGSPFVVSQETQWTLNASSPSGTSQKQSIFITNSSKQFHFKKLLVLTT